MRIVRIYKFCRVVAMLWVVLIAVLVALLWATWKKPRLTSSIVWAMTATVLATSGAILLLPTDLKATLLWNSLAIPLVWAGFIFWCYWDRRPFRPAAGLIGLSVLGAVIVTLAPAPV